MPSNATAVRDQATRRLYIATRLSDELIDLVDELQIELREQFPDNGKLHGQIDEIGMMTAVLNAELDDLEL